MIPAFLYPCFVGQELYVVNTNLAVDSANLAFVGSELCLIDSKNPKICIDVPGQLVFSGQTLGFAGNTNFPVAKADLAFTGQSVDLISSAADVVSLTGTAGSPITINGFGKYPGGSSKAYLRANTSGALEKATTNIAGVLSAYTQIGSDWVSPLSTYTESYWVRATKVSGDNLVSGTLGSWLALTTTREWKQEALGSTYSFDYAETLLKLEISTDVSGSPIVATGYYKLIADWQSLE